MMDVKIYFAALLLAFVAALLIGRSITGFVVSQSCCAGPTCAADSKCEYERPLAPQPFDGIIGVVLLTIALGAIALAARA